MKYPFRLVVIILLLSGCGSGNREQNNETATVKLSPEQAEKLAGLPLACLQQEYPNKPGLVLGSAADMGEPSFLHPAFYGCFDWHSAVHGHWSLVWLLKNHPGLQTDSLSRAILEENLSAGNILREVDYFNREEESTFERTYGWGWLLKLAEEIHDWEDPLARELETNLEPLENLIAGRYMDFLPRLIYPIRVGEHSNTAFGLAFAWDYAKTTGRDSLLALIDLKAREFYMEDRACPLEWEPSGFDFLSPCLTEIDLMMRVLPGEEFLRWLAAFMPSLADPDFCLEPARVSDRSDGKLVHLDGLNFSRAWVLYGLASRIPGYEHLLPLARQHMEYSLPNLTGDSYEGGHWLASFALFAMDCRPN